MYHLSFPIAQALEKSDVAIEFAGCDDCEFLYIGPEHICPSAKEEMAYVGF